MILINRIENYSTLHVRKVNISREIREVEEQGWKQTRGRRSTLKKPDEHPPSHFHRPSNLFFTGPSLICPPSHC